MPEAEVKYFVDMSEINSTLLLEEGTVIASIEIPCKSGNVVEGVISVYGKPRIEYEGNVYTGVKTFPSELINIIKSGNELSLAVDEYNACVFSFRGLTSVVYITGYTNEQVYRVMAEIINRAEGDILPLS